MPGFKINRLFLSGLLFFAQSAMAAVIPEYAANTYTDHDLDRSEKKCIEEGYKITYANCTNQTAPADRCPYNDAYYRTCSQEQWCRNNNFTFLASDCKLPTFPVKKCDNQYSIYRACVEDVAKACLDSGFVHKDKCQLTDVRCPYNSDYGKCCNDCPDFTYAIDQIPAGYVAEGPTCTTCSGITKTNVVEASCDGYTDCPFGPLSQQTPSCLKGEHILYTACKTAEMVCKEKGFVSSSCKITEDPQFCAEDPNFKKCIVNCYKLAQQKFPEAEIIAQDVTDPVFALSKLSLRSLYGHLSDECVSNVRPEITLNINDTTFDAYSRILNRDIENVNFILNFEKPLPLAINGNLTNVRITATGDIPECPLKGELFNVNKTVSLVGFSNICANINVADSAKFITTGSITGDVNLGKDSSLAIKGNLIGRLTSKSYAQIFIKGILKYTDEAKASTDSESLLFGCNSRVKVAGGIIAETANVVIKQRSILDTPYIKLISTGNDPNLPGMLSSIHLQKYSKITSILDNAEYAMTENNDISCDDMYLIHLGSSVDTSQQSLSLEPSNLLEDKWQCRKLTRQQQECN